MMDEMCGGATSLDQFQRAFNTAIADPNIKAVVVNAATPGGSVYGTQETFNTIFRARGTKPIVGQVNSLAASAGYWVLSACDEIAMTPSGEVGSVGVFCLHLDSSKAVGAAGIKPTFITSGGSPYKVEGNGLEPLTAEAAQAVQDSVDRYFRAFVGDVAKGRGVTPNKVMADYGKGRVLGAQAALAAGMIDRIAPLSATLASLVRGRSPAGASASTADAFRRARHRRRMVSV
ncbi:MAG TPA: S49 family peptidase [Acidobacteriaceae bacterium]|jgi:signal peptide peptidase SppA|nr:S49 family peptidase [Acidobacteriaceae bacterium]